MSNFFNDLWIDSWLEQELDELDVLVLDGDDQSGPAERVDAVDVEDVLLLAQRRDDPLDGGKVATFDVKKEELEQNEVGTKQGDFLPRPTRGVFWEKRLDKPR